MTFVLHPNFSNKLFVAALPLCTVLLENNANYPWLILVPRRDNMCHIVDLTYPDQLQLLQELNMAQRIMLAEFSPDRLNVAALGNKTPQLHIHVIARFTGDPAWPEAVWGEVCPAIPYTPEQAVARRVRLSEKFDVYHNPV